MNHDHDLQKLDKKELALHHLLVSVVEHFAHCRMNAKQTS